MAKYDYRKRRDKLLAKTHRTLRVSKHVIRIDLDQLDLERRTDGGVRKESLLQSVAVQRARQALERLDSAKHGSFYHNVVGLLDSLNTVSAVFGTNVALSKHRKFLVELIADLREQRRKARALMVRAMRAIFNIPLFLDGPELSGYRHRLR